MFNRLTQILLFRIFLVFKLNLPNLLLLKLVLKYNWYVRDNSAMGFEILDTIYQNRDNKGNCSEEFVFRG